MSREDTVTVPGLPGGRAGASPHLQVPVVRPEVSGGHPRTPAREGTYLPLLSKGEESVTTREERFRPIKERFEGWADLLMEAEASPIVVIGLGPGGMLVLTTEDVTDEELAGIFGPLAQHMKTCARVKRIKGGNGHGEATGQGT